VPLTGGRRQGMWCMSQGICCARRWVLAHSCASRPPCSPCRPAHRVGAPAETASLAAQCQRQSLAGPAEQHDNDGSAIAWPPSLEVEGHYGGVSTHSRCLAGWIKLMGKHGGYSTACCKACACMQGARYIFVCAHLQGDVEVLLLLSPLQQPLPLRVLHA
jgi:hypothetical protein